ncbi:UNKNOWN [Stylonychia lemnae]|uniref:TLDc domain-containing protein n=1 Tax=Stylonychia lemnae TaxID=5949 RepID=A0A078B3P2_STYLE|nr:UNKNOWN [Stylonychia lemnae]|eukprot:CDW89155.1 UNKNOWN [Stylonychia lemnae]
MDRTLLLNGQTPITTQKSSTKKRVVRDLAIFSVGFAICYALISSSQSSNLDGVQNTQTLLSTESSSFTLEESSTLKWSQAGHFADIAFSPSGDFYGIQEYGQDKTISRLAYKFNFDNGLWSPLDKSLQVKDIKFDKAGNFYLLDTSNQVYAQNSKSAVILKDIQDFVVGSNGMIYAISSNPSQPNSVKWIKGDGFQYKLLSPQSFSKLVLKDDQPLFVDANGKTVSYGEKCVKDITVGADSSVWALSCEKRGELGDFKLIKWDPSTLQWLNVNNAFGVKVAAFNETSISVLDSQGRIQFSSELSQEPEEKPNSKLFIDSKILNQTNLGFVQSLVDEKYTVSIICWRASDNGFRSRDFHNACDFTGPTLTILKTTKGRIAGGYTSKTWTNSFSWITDKDAFLYSADHQVKIPIKEGGVDAIYDDHNFGPTFGRGFDLYVASGSDGSDRNRRNYANLGTSYTLPEGVSAGSNEAHSFLFGEYYYVTTELEVYTLL